MKMIQNLETWLLYGGSLDERIRMGFDKAGYLGFLVFLIGGAGLGSGFRDVIDAGTLFPPGMPRVCVMTAAPMTEVWTNVRRETCMVTTV